MTNPALGATTVSSTNISASSYTTTAVNTQASGSSFLITVVQITSSTVPTFSADTYSNTYTLVSFGSGTNPEQEPSNLQYVFTYAALGGSGGNNHRVTVTAGSGNLLYVEFTEITNSHVIDASAGNSEASGISSSLSNPVTTSVANDFVYGTGFTGAAINCTAGTGFTQNSNVETSLGGFGSCYLANASQGSNDPDMSKGGNSGGFAVATLAFKPVAAPSNPVGSPLLLLGV
jgi:hypothetical protein